MSVLASDIADSAAIILNDTARNLYTNTTQLPYIKKASEDLEQLLQSYGIDIQFKKSATIDLAANTLTLTLPSDFMLPLRVFERVDGSTSEDDWLEIYEKDWEDNAVPASTLTCWSYRNNNINFIGATTPREIRLYYIRTLAAITSASSPVDSTNFKNFLAAKTAEYCARFVGMNTIFANEIRDNESSRAEDMLVRMYVLNMQGVRHRRGQYTSKSGGIII